MIHFSRHQFAHLFGGRLVAISKATQKEAIDALLALAGKHSVKISRAFLESLAKIQGEIALSKLEAALKANDISTVDRIVAQAVAQGDLSAVSAASTDALIEGGKAAAKNASDALPRALDVHFDAINPKVAAWQASNTANLVREISAETRATLRAVILEAVKEGRNPRDTARDIKQSIGLTVRQEMAVQNYRKELETGSQAALNRALRDKRFDAATAKAKETLLPKAKIDQMVARYRERYIKYRAETIGRTESIRALQAGQQELWQQAVADGKFSVDEVRRSWIYTHDGRVRDAHRLIPTMNPKGVGMNEPFVSQLGPIMYPGDPKAPSANTINCRCTVLIRYVPTVAEKPMGPMLPAPSLPQAPAGIPLPALPAKPPAPPPIPAPSLPQGPSGIPLPPIQVPAPAAPTPPAAAPKPPDKAPPPFPPLGSSLAELDEWSEKRKKWQAGWDAYFQSIGKPLMPFNAKTYNQFKADLTKWRADLKAWYATQSEKHELPTNFTDYIAGRLPTEKYESKAIQAFEGTELKLWNKLPDGSVTPPVKAPKPKAAKPAPAAPAKPKAPADIYPPFPQNATEAEIKAWEAVKLQWKKDWDAYFQALGKPLFPFHAKTNKQFEDELEKWKVDIQAWYATQTEKHELPIAMAAYVNERLPSAVAEMKATYAFKNVEKPLYDKLPDKATGVAPKPTAQVQAPAAPALPSKYSPKHTDGLPDTQALPGWQKAWDQYLISKGMPPLPFGKSGAELGAAINKWKKDAEKWLAAQPYKVNFPASTASYLEGRFKNYVDDNEVYDAIWKVKQNNDTKPEEPAGSAVAPAPPPPSKVKVPPESPYGTGLTLDEWQKQAIDYYKAIGKPIIPFPVSTDTSVMYLAKMEQYQKDLEAWYKTQKQKHALMGGVSMISGKIGNHGPVGAKALALLKYDQDLYKHYFIDPKGTPYPTVASLTPAPKPGSSATATYQPTQSANLPPQEIAVAAPTRSERHADAKKATDLWNNILNYYKNKNHGAWKGKLGPITDDQIALVRSYTGNSIFRPLNEALRNGRATEKQKVYEKALNGAIKDMAEVLPPSRKVLYRGYRFQDLDGHEKMYRDHMSNNKPVVWNAFSSTSTSLSTARGFGNVVVTIINPKTTVDVMTVSEYPGESEYLMPTGIKLKIHSVKREGYRLHIEAEELIEKKVEKRKPASRTAKAALIKALKAPMILPGETEDDYFDYNTDWGLEYRMTFAGGPIFLDTVIDPEQYENA